MRVETFVTALWQLVRAATPGDGRRLEQAVRDMLVSRRLRSDHVPGGYSLLGIGSASGWCHQMDVEAHLDDAVLVVELKAYRGTLPKHDLLQFVAATDDLFAGQYSYPGRLPVLRAIAGTFATHEAERIYAAMHGVLLVEPTIVPAVILALPSLSLPSELTGLSDAERQAVQSMTRPIRDQLRSQSRVAGPGLQRVAFRFGVQAQAQWSARLLGPTQARPPVVVVGGSAA